MTDDTVTVPRELLRRVLDDASENMNLVEEWGDDVTQDRTRIEALSKAAGMEKTPGTPALDALAAEAQESGAYDEVGNWRKYVSSVDWLERVADGNSRAAPHAFIVDHTPQGRAFWMDVYRRRATPDMRARAREFARRVLKAMGYTPAMEEEE